MSESDKKIDITKTGPVGFRALQRANSADFASQNENDPFVKLLNEMRAQRASRTLFDPAKHAEQDMESPLMQQRRLHGEGNEYWGRSMFDPKSATDYELQNLGDIRAMNQPWYSKIAAGTAKGVVTAATTFAELGGLMYGVGQGIYNASNGGSFLEGLWNNPITKVLQNINEWSEDVMPNYYTRDEQERPFSHLFSSNFIGDKIIKNLGFMVGAFYAGMPIAAGIGKLGKTIGKIATTVNKGKTAGAALEAAELTGKYGDDAARLAEELKAAHLTDAERAAIYKNGINTLTKTAGITRSTAMIVGSFSSAVNEGAIEAINNSKDWANSEIYELDNWRNQMLEEAKEKYGDDPEELADANEGIEKKYEWKRAEIERRRADVGNADFLLNIPILMASNVFQLGSLYARGFGTSRKMMGNIFDFNTKRRQMGGLFNWYKLPGKLAEGTVKTGKTKLGGVLTSLAKVNTEGLEEYFQRAASDGSGKAVAATIQRYFDDDKLERTDNDLIDYITGFARAVKDNLSDSSALEEYVIGALSACLGMPVYGSQARNANLKIGKNFGFSGGLAGHYNDYIKDMEAEDKVAKYLNGRVKSSELKTLITHLKRHGDINELLKDSLLAKDKRQFKNLEFESLFEDINAAASAGHLGEYMEMLGLEESEYSDEELAKIVEQTSVKVKAAESRAQDEAIAKWLETNIEQQKQKGDDADTSLLSTWEEELTRIRERLTGEYKDITTGPFIREINGNSIGMDSTPALKEEMISILNNNKKNIASAIESYLKIRDAIDIESNGSFNDKQISTLTRIRAFIENYGEREADMAVEFVNTMGNSIDNTVELKEQRQQALETAKQELEEAKEKLTAAEADQSTKKSEKKRLAKKVAEKEREVANAETRLKNMDTMSEFLDILLGTKETTFWERYGRLRGAGNSRFASLREALNPSEELKNRQLTAEELEAYFKYPENAAALVRYINKDLDVEQDTKNKLIDIVRDMYIIGHEKDQYKKLFRKYMGDISLLEEEMKESQQKLSEKEIQNKADTVAIKMQRALTMEELDRVMVEARNMGKEVVEAALKKAKETDDETVKKFIEDYEKGVSFFGSFIKQIYTLPTEERKGGVFSTAQSAWEYVLANSVDLEKDFIAQMEAAAKDLKQKGRTLADRQLGEDITTILKNLREASDSVNTNSEVQKSTPRKNSSSSDTTPDASDRSAAQAMQNRMQRRSGNNGNQSGGTNAATNNGEDNNNDNGPQDGAKSTDSIDTLSDAIEEAIRDSINVYGIPTMTYAKLPSKLQNRIREFNTANPGTQIGESLFNTIYEKVTNSIIEDDNPEITSDEEEASDMYSEDNTELRDAMIDDLSTNFKSDRVSNFEYGLYYRDRHNPKVEQLLKVQALLEKLGAYDFVDHNLLGYLYRELEPEDIPIHFIKSTDPEIDGKNGKDSVIFLAIEWDSKVEAAIRKHAYKNGAAIPELQLKTINGKQYQFIGTLTYDKDNAASEVKKAFENLQAAINEEIEEKKNSFPQDSIPEFIASRLTSEISTIFTGRLEKYLNSDGETANLSLQNFLSQSEEWKAKEPFYFGVVVNRDVKQNIPESTLWVSPNDSWMKKNNGAILLYVRKPDGKYYPIRCVRKTVKEWMGEHPDIIDEILRGDINNNVFNTITKALKILLDPNINPEQKMPQKVALSKMFAFKGNSPFHFDMDGFYLYVNGNRYDITGDTFEEQVHNFFSTISRDDVDMMFSIPAHSPLSTAEIVNADILKVKLSGFYNFNANFTIAPIDTEGNFLNISSIDNNAPGGRQANVTSYSFDLGDGMKTYTKLEDGTFLHEGKKVDSRKQNLLTLLTNMQSNPLLVSKLSELEGICKLSEKLQKAIPGYNLVHYIEDGKYRWIYDERRSQNNRLVKYDSAEGRKIVEELVAAANKALKDMVESTKNLGKLNNDNTNDGENNSDEENNDEENTDEEEGSGGIRPIVVTGGSNNTGGNNEGGNTEGRFIGKKIEDISGREGSIELFLTGIPKGHAVHMLKALAAIEAVKPISDSQILSMPELDAYRKASTNEEKNAKFRQFLSKLQCG